MGPIAGPPIFTATPRVVNSTTSVQCKPPCVWTDTVQSLHSTVWSRQLALPYGTEGGRFVLQFDLGAAVQGLPKKIINSLGLL
jgi:hypothetical protein